MSVHTSDDMQAVRIMLVEDEPLFRDLIKRACAFTQGIIVTMDFATGEEAVEAIAASAVHRPPIDVAVVDIQLPGVMNGIQTAFRLRQIVPEVGILLLSQHRWPAFLSMLDDFCQRGFSYLLKSKVIDFEALERAIVGTAAGGVVVDEALLLEVPEPGGPFAKLTERQKEILHLVAQGYSNALIAKTLHLSGRTVENHLAHIYQVLGIDNQPLVQPRVRAVVAYLTLSGISRSEPAL